MATINSLVMVKALIANNGHYKDDPQVQCIYSYVNAYNVAVYAIYYNNFDLKESEYIREPVLLWAADIGLTVQGEAL